MNSITYNFLWEQAYILLRKLGVKYDLSNKTLEELQQLYITIKTQDNVRNLG